MRPSTAESKPETIPIMHAISFSSPLFLCFTAGAGLLCVTYNGAAPGWTVPDSEATAASAEAGAVADAGAAGDGVAADNGVDAVAIADKGAFPEGTTMVVTPLTGDRLAEVETLLENNVGQFNTMAFYDITFTDADGKEVEPAFGDVDVTIQPEVGLDTKGIDIVLFPVVKMQHRILVSLPKTNSLWHNSIP